MEFKFYLAVSLTISITSALPQLYYDPYFLWRNGPNPRSIPRFVYYSNQPAEYANPQEYRPSQPLIRDKHYHGSPEVGGPSSDGYISSSHKDNPKTDHDVMYGTQNSDFVFPGLVNVPQQTNLKTTTDPPQTRPFRRSNRFVPDVKNCNPKLTYCEEVDNYPADFIKNALQNTSENFDDFFGQDELVSVNVTTRIGVSDDGGTPMCEAYEQVVQPNAAQNKDGDWKFIVNDSEHYIGIRVERCSAEGKPCAMADSFPMSYVTECKQKYIYRKLLAMEHDGNIKSDSFRLPSCCVCVYRSK